MKSKQAELILLIVGIFWGLGYITSDNLLNSGMNPYTVIGYRFLIGALGVYILSPGRLKYNFNELKKCLIIGGILFLGMASQTVALNYTTTTNVSLITSLNIIFVPFIVYFISGKKIELKNIVAAIIGVFAIYILVGNMSALNIGDLLTLLSALFYALHISFIGKFVGEMDVKKLVIGQMIITSIMGFIIAIFLGSSIIHEVSQVHLYDLLYIGLISSSLCFYLQNLGLRYTSESKGSLILSTEALWGMIFSIILLHEPLTINIIIGAIVLMVAIFIDEIF